MFDFLKDISILLFSIANEVEKKADEFKKEREEKFKDFEEKTKEKQEEFKQKAEEFKKNYENDFEKTKEKIEEFFSKLGIATKDDIKEIKDMISELNKKIDQILNK
mgnify:FL=1